MSQMTIRPLQTAAEMALCEPLQIAAWAMPDATDSVPAHQLLAAAKYGGLVLGAFAGSDLIGLNYSFVGLHQHRPIWISHMLAVHPAYRGKGIGLQLKLEQRRLAMEQGIESIQWTYDPLELVNGTLNIRRLGGIARTYLRDFYGTMNDGLNAGLPSDRLVVEWEIASDRVERALAEGAAPVPDGEEIPVPVPAQFQRMKQQDPAQALEVRLATREIFEQAFAAGYQLTGVEGYMYILTREEGSR